MDIFTKPIEAGKLLVNLSTDDLRKMGKADEKTTVFGSPMYTSKVRNRSAKNTEVTGVEPTSDQVQTLLKVREYLKTKELILTQRQLCMTDGYKIPCNLYTSVAYPRLPYMWSNLFLPQEKNLTEKPLTSIDIPEWPERKIIIDPIDGVTFILGTDYFGEIKKSFLRMGMYRTKMKGGLGLHAGSKILRIKDNNGKIVEKGMILFGLSGTGKTTLTCHHHFLEGEEGVVIRQDDVIFMYPDTRCIGTENNYYIKTEGLEPKGQPVLYKAATSPNAVLENVWVNDDGSVDFDNAEYTSNGRGIVQRSEVMYTDNQIDLPRCDLMVFITRREDIIPPLVRLTPEQGAAFFMLGESIETSAGDPTKAGQSKREVGTNPFIVGPCDDEGNYIMNILKTNPHMKCYLLNTGKIGGKEKITVVDSASFLTNIAKDNVKWRKDEYWGYEVPVEVPGVDMKRFDPANYYSADQIKAMNDKLRDERKAWLAQFPVLDKAITDTI